MILGTVSLRVLFCGTERLDAVLGASGYLGIYAGQLEHPFLPTSPVARACDDGSSVRFAGHLTMARSIDANLGRIIRACMAAKFRVPRALETSARPLRQAW